MSVGEGVFELCSQFKRREQVEIQYSCDGCYPLFAVVYESPHCSVLAFPTGMIHLASQIMVVNSHWGQYKRLKCNSEQCKTRQ